MSEPERMVTIPYEKLADVFHLASDALDILEETDKYDEEYLTQLVCNLLATVGDYVDEDEGLNH